MLGKPATDPTPIFELFRGSYGSELLTAAVAHFHLFEQLASGPLSVDGLAAKLELALRPAHVLTTALRAMGLLEQAAGKLRATPLAAEHLLAETPFEVCGYLSLAAQSPGVLEMVERLRSNRPAGADDAAAGAAFIYRDGMPSAMEREASARHFTLALAGRARNVAPFLAEAAELRDATCLLDVAGGTGIYSIACLQRYPKLRVIVFDRPEVLRIASELAASEGVADRLECVAGDMFADKLPAGCDALLLSNVLHDWDVPECKALLARCAHALPAGGQLLIHDVFLEDDLGGPLPIALYSAALFCFTEGRAYSAAEYRQWLEVAGFQAGAVRPTLVHCGLLTSRAR